MRQAHAYLEHELESAAEQMSAIDEVRQAWQALPPEIKQDIMRRLKQLWDTRGASWARLMAALNTIVGRNPALWRLRLLQNRGATAHRLALIAGRMAGLRARGAGAHPPGMSPVQVRQYHQRQQARGRVPGRNPQTRPYRELELELEVDLGGRELAFEQAEPFYTKVMPFPPGNKEGHEILLRHAMAPLTTMTPAQRAAVMEGMITADRGGMSYWAFPRGALEALKARTQPSHSLRPTPATSVPEALRLIRARFRGLYRRAMRDQLASKPREALKWIGHALHLLQDSFSAAHVERVGGTGRIRTIRVYFIRLGWPPLSRPPHEHGAPSDSRDDVRVGSVLRRESRAAIYASTEFLRMVLRHLANPREPRNQIELAQFMNRYLAM
jgi:hypothetical protein